MSISTNTTNTTPTAAELNSQLVDASAQGNAEEVKLLLKLGADVNVGGCLALQLASYEGRTEVVQLLLEAGADVYARDDIAEEVEGNPFHGSDEIVRMLTDWES